MKKKLMQEDIMESGLGAPHNISVARRGVGVHVFPPHF